MDNTTAQDAKFYARFVSGSSASVSSPVFGGAAYVPARSFEFVICAMERCVAGMLLILSSPVFAAAAVAVLVLSKKSPLVAHKRVGYKGRDLWVLKLRTMWQRDSERTLGFLEYLPLTPVPQSKRRPDPRVTSHLAKFCRKYSIDEIPQLWQVVKGEMALVGPRPITRLELAEYYGEFGSSLIQVRPGLVGLWQVRGRSRLTYKQRRKFDEFLVCRWSLRLYMHVLLKSICCVLAGDEAY
jgi:lipopolysaccharide/colanic/teichoic acid biosynthesis glycosyltransferase